MFLDVNIDPIDQVIKPRVAFPAEGFQEHPAQEDKADGEEQNAEQQRPNEEPLLVREAGPAFWDAGLGGAAHTALLVFLGSGFIRSGRTHIWQKTCSGVCGLLCGHSEVGNFSQGHRFWRAFQVCRCLNDGGWNG